VGGVGLTVYYFINPKMILDASVPLLLVFFLLFSDSLVCRVILLAFSYQFMTFLLPILQYARNHMASTYLAYHEDVSTKGKVERLSHSDFVARKKLVIASTVFQSFMVYSLNQVFFTFVVGFEDRVNLDVHPYAGKIGVKNWDRYPIVSAFLMVFHKYGLFVVWLIYDWKTLQLPLVVYKPAKKAWNHTVDQKYREWFANQPTLTFLLYFAQLNLGMLMMWMMITQFHGEQQAVCLLVLVGILGMLHCLIVLIEQARTARGYQQKHFKKDKKLQV